MECHDCNKAVGDGHKICKVCNRHVHLIFGTPEGEKELWPKRHVLNMCEKLRWVTAFSSRGGVIEDVLGLEDTFWSPWPWPRSLKSSKIALSSARGQHYFWTVEISLENARNLAENLRTPFCFLHLEHNRRHGEGGRAPLFLGAGSPQLKFHQRQKCDKKAYCFFSFSFFLAFFADNSITI